MDDKHHQETPTENIHEHQEHRLHGTIAGQINHENFNHLNESIQSPKVTVSLPKHAALKLHDLVQRRDIALIKLGIISVQFEDDQIIPLTQQNAGNSTTNQNKQINQLTVSSRPNKVEPIIASCNAESTSTPTATTTTTTTCASSMTTSKAANTLAVVYDDEDEDDKDENEVVNEVENQHSGYNIHQLTQLDFADPVDLEMYDSDNLLFPDYTLNLS